jgi:hypothetical protein
MNLDDPVLLLAISGLAPDDQVLVALEGLKRQMDEIAAMVPHQPFADAEIKAARLVLRYAICKKVPGIHEWCDSVGQELSAHLKRLRPDSPPYPIGDEEEEPNG